MSKLPRSKGILLQHIYDDRLIEEFKKRHGWEYLSISSELMDMLYKSRAHAKRITRAYNKSRKDGRKEINKSNTNRVFYPTRNEDKLGEGGA